MFTANRLYLTGAHQLCTLIDINNYGNLTKLLAITAYVMRFTNNAKHNSSQAVDVWSSARTVLGRNPKLEVAVKPTLIGTTAEIISR